MSLALGSCLIQTAMNRVVKYYNGLQHISTVIYSTVLVWRVRMICSLAEHGLGSFTHPLALGFEIGSLFKTWKPISDVTVLYCNRQN
jgi:hypothetical protein